MTKLELELDNLRSVLRWSIVSDHVEPGLLLIENFFFWGDHCTEGRRWAAELLASPNAQVRTVDRFYPVYSDAFLAYFQGDYPVFQARIDELLSLAHDIGDPRLNSYVQFPTGCLLLAQGDYPGAFLAFDELRRSASEEENWPLAAFCLYMLGSTMLSTKDFDQANSYLKSALDLFQEVNELYGTMEAIIKMGYVALERGDYIQAGKLFQAGLERAQTIGTRRRMVNCILGFAGVALEVGELPRSACLFGAAEAMVKVTGSRLDQPDEAAINSRNLAALRVKLDDGTFSTAWQEGMKMDFGELIAHALEGTQAKI